MRLIWSAPGYAVVRLGALFSGGKDSTFAIYRAKKMRHEVACLITMHPAADDSLLFHYPNSGVTKYLAEAMQIPLIELTVTGRSKDDEIRALEEAIAQAKSRYGIQGVVHGGISSKYQKQAFEEICNPRGLAAVAPLWNVEPTKYMSELLRHDFKIMIVGVSAMGLGKEWLGKKLGKGTLAKLAELAKKYDFNLTFEGGEGETLVTDCPLFRRKLKVKSAKMHWDGQRGIFEILDVALVEK
jgi:diphthine-ammonia ligase